MDPFLLLHSTCLLPHPTCLPLLTTILLLFFNSLFLLPTQQAQEEIRILEHLKKQDKENSYNIVHMLDSFVFRNHICITFELLSMNLYELIKKNKFQGFSLQLVRKFAHSILQCLDALQKNRIIHCDLKPENVLLKQQGRSGIKVGQGNKAFVSLFNCLLGYLSEVCE